MGLIITAYMQQALGSLMEKLNDSEPNIDLLVQMVKDIFAMSVKSMDQTARTGAFHHLIHALVLGRKEADGEKKGSFRGNEVDLNDYKKQVSGIHHNHTTYTLVYHILGRTTLSTVLINNSLNTILSQLEPDSKYFIKLCVEGNDERHKRCTNTTVQTKVGGAIGGVFMLLIIVTVVYCKCRSRRQNTSSSGVYVELPVNVKETANPKLMLSIIVEMQKKFQSQNSSGHGNCCFSFAQEESSFTESSKDSNSGSSSTTDSHYFHTKNGKDYQENKEKLVDFKSGDKNPGTPIDVDSSQTNDRKNRKLIVNLI
ncbi:unnamed protein product [Mytilus edulis]|uniref:Uncharacterized protein n=1 Tax=Mytilus edulis TaxID=6550 RepID=A0A8S3UZK1_MYTED|nr:unnamed protein product [Mytilus edulis]